MKFITLLLLLFTPIISSAENFLINSNKLFDFAEKSYPEYFSPAGVTTTTLDQYLVRYYPDTDNYIGTKGEEVYVYGNIFNGLLRSGVISDHIELEADGDELLAQLFANIQGDVQVYGNGVVVSILSDDLVGSRHQRFIVELKSKQTLLIAHNIDLAPRIDTLSLDDQIEFYGEYEWNDKGGVIHWTHHDPEEMHVNGWIFHNNIIYQ
ncbi:Protein of unknown function [Nitrosomonas cryotolerans]|uniref:DUF3465 domain-containing protein n=1 Tax=Nitrosomonas cryotolerans ATCC 49181 TaxID=1131553 RepID=A0A1N6JCC1_9PROT|nr:DUF3465 domain-containing protein [Nitrosomonas cryotolerans]SFP48625.1 Protein of unknown function [Nitrosomonas cryotolerans]SIO41861.1 Protein of unknown function [Nitrosomonas cryotolerans ATCC 49181]